MQTAHRLNLSDAIDDVAPPPPPCFLNAAEWRSYLKSAAAVQNQRNEQRVVFLADGGVPAFDLDYDFCRDCSAQHRASHERLGTCKPHHLKDLLDA